MTFKWLWPKPRLTPRFTALNPDGAAKNSFPPLPPLDPVKNLLGATAKNTMKNMTSGQPPQAVLAAGAGKAVKDTAKQLGSKLMC